MIASLTGALASKTPTDAVVNVQGVCFSIQIPVSTFSALGEVGSTVTLLTHLQVREDALVLYGFATSEERSMFRSLISVNGIGPRLAQNILSGVSSTELRHLIAAGDTTSLTRIPGIGKKTAERIVIELRERLAKETGSSGSIDVQARTPMAIRSEALEAMLTLGFQRSVAEKAIRAVLNEQKGEDLSVEELLRKSLRGSGLK